MIATKEWGNALLHMDKNRDIYPTGTGAFCFVGLLVLIILMAFLIAEVGKNK